MRRAGVLLLAVAVIYLFMGGAAGSQEYLSESTVRVGHWSYAAINRLAERGFVHRFRTTVFLSGEGATRYELAERLSFIFKNMETDILIDKGITLGDIYLIKRLLKEYAIDMAVNFAGEYSDITQKVTVLEQDLSRKRVEERGKYIPSMRPKKTAEEPVEVSAEEPAEEPAEAPAEAPVVETPPVIAPPADDEGGLTTSSIDYTGQWEVYFGAVDVGAGTSMVEAYESDNSSKYSGKTYYNNVSIEREEWRAGDFYPIMIKIMGQTENRAEDAEMKEFEFSLNRGYRGVSIGRKVKPDWSEYSYRNKDLRGGYYFYEFEELQHKVEFLSGMIDRPDTTFPRAHINGASDQFTAAHNMVSRITAYQVKEKDLEKHRVFCIDNQYAATQSLNIEWEVAHSQVKKDLDIATSRDSDRYAWRFKPIYKGAGDLSWDFEYEDIGTDFVNWGNPGVSSDIRRSDLRQMQLNATYKINQFFTNIFGWTRAQQNNNDVTADAGDTLRAPQKSYDASYMGIYTKPDKPRIIYLLKYSDKEARSSNPDLTPTDQVLIIKLLKVGDTIQGIKTDLSWTRIDLVDVSSPTAPFALKTNTYNLTLKKTLWQDVATAVGIKYSKTDGSASSLKEEFKYELTLEKPLDENTTATVIISQENVNPFKGGTNTNKLKDVASLELSRLTSEHVKVGTYFEYIEYKDFNNPLTSSYRSLEAGVRFTYLF